MLISNYSGEEQEGHLLMLVLILKFVIRQIPYYQMVVIYYLQTLLVVLLYGIVVLRVKEITPPMPVT